MECDDLTISGMWSAERNHHGKRITAAAVPPPNAGGAVQTAVGPDTEKNAHCILEALRDGKEGRWACP
jgi:hypothetical protein